MSRIGRVGLVIAALAVIVLVAFPFGSFVGHAHWDRVGWLPFVSPPITALDIIGNVLLGGPAGLAIATQLGGSILLTAALVAPVALLCEAAQVYSHGRFPNATDLVCNVGGAMLATRWFARRPRAHAR